MSLPGNKKMRKNAAQTTSQMALVTAEVCAFAKSQFFASSSNELFTYRFSVVDYWVNSTRGSLRATQLVLIRSSSSERVTPQKIFRTYTFLTNFCDLRLHKSLDHHRTNSVKTNLQNGPSWTWHPGVLPHQRGWEGRLHAGTTLRPWFQQKGWEGHTIGVNEIESHFEESILEM